MKKLVAVCLTLVLLCLATGFASAAPEKTASAEEAVAKTAMDVLSGIPDLPEPDSDQEADLIRAADEANELIRQQYLDQGYQEVQENEAVALSDVDDETYRLAYMDLEQANAEMQKKILDARGVIIYTRSWRGDSVIGVKANAVKKEFSILPTFSEVFPGWDYGQIIEHLDEKTDADAGAAESVASPTSANDDFEVIREVNTGAALPVPSSTNLTPDFYQIAAAGERKLEYGQSVGYGACHLH